jgi:hypothetical protein
MPLTPVDYSKTLIYKLVHKDDYDNANIYIGSTTDFARRKNKHKSNCYNEKHKSYNEKKYQYIRDNGGWDEWEMVLVERHNCNDGNEARAREEYWRSHYNAKLNMMRAYRTEEQRKEQMKEYFENNKDKIKGQKKDYREEHKDKIAEQQKAYYEQYKDEILEQKKEYYETNQEKIIQQAKQNYEQNKDKILEQKKEKITCECGCIITKVYLAKHKKTQNHIKLLDAITNNDI